jgi:acetylornithine deacetylase/succinyl-diaminopimelate desuccinylase-like protein
MRRHATLLLCVCITASIALAQRPAVAGPKPPTSAQTSQATGLQIDWDRVNAEAVQRLAEYIRIDTSNPPGNEIRGVEWLKQIFRAEGIPFETGESEPGRASIAARLKGQGKEPALVLLSHVDVVPVNREFWTADPFAAEIRDGYLWGRGAVDTKSLTIAGLEAMLLLHRNRVPLRRDVILLATADEEAGGTYGAGWVVKNHPEWIAGAGFLLNEAARAVADDSGKPLYFRTGPTEKTPAWLKLTAKGRAGHGAIPNPDSAVNRLVAALERLRAYRPPLQVTPPVEYALRTQAPYEPEPWRSRFADIRSYIQTPGAYEELLKRPPILALLENTIAITGLEGSKKINIVPPVASAELDCRLLPGTTVEQWIQEVRKVVQDDSISIDVILNFPPTESKIDTPLHASIERAVKQLYPAAGLIGAVDTGFTDSHFFREKDITSYGFGPFPMKLDDLLRVHGNDERIPVDSFTGGVRLLWEVVYDLSRSQ